MILNLFCFVTFYFVKKTTTENWWNRGSGFRDGQSMIYFFLNPSHKHSHTVYQYISENIDPSFWFLVVFVNSISFAIKLNKLINFTKRCTAGVIIQFCKYFQMILLLGWFDILWIFEAPLDACNRPFKLQIYYSEIYKIMFFSEYCRKSLEKYFLGRFVFLQELHC